MAYLLATGIYIIQFETHYRGVSGENSQLFLSLSIAWSYGNGARGSRPRLQPQSLQATGCCHRGPARGDVCFSGRQAVIRRCLQPEHPAVYQAR